MSKPSNSKAAARSKPKRPLSGYNLFYRYKRNKILEATSRPNHDNEAIIRAVLTAPPGLEGVSPASPLFCLPPAQLGQFRSAAIRHAMAGRLFPNENTRNRQHCKVHGMGFVEMGRMMRQMWGRADKLAKDVFCELADVGRVRYRRLVAEYKLSGDHPTNVHVKSTPVESSVVEKAAQTQTSIKRAAVAAAVNPVKREAMAALPATNAKAEATAKAFKLSPIPRQTPSSMDPMSEALSVWATKNPPPAVAATAAVRSAEPKPKKKEDSRPSYGRRVSTDLDFQGPVPRHARSFGRSRGDLFEPLSFNATINPTATANVPADTTEKRGYGRRVSTELDHYGDSLFEPLPVETGDASAAPRFGNQPKWGRRVSTDHFPLPPTHGSMGGAVTDNGTANSSSDANLERLTTNLKRQQILLRNAIKKIQYQIAENNSVLPPEMQVRPQDNVSGEKAYLDIMASGTPSSPDSAVVGSDSPGVGEDPEEEGVSARGFVDFIDELDDAIGDHSIDVHAIEKTEDLADVLADSAHSIEIDVAAGAIEAKDCAAMASTDGNLDSMEDSCHAYIFGKPMFDMPSPDFGLKPVSPSQISIPMPDAVELKTNRARMA